MQCRLGMDVVRSVVSSININEIRMNEVTRFTGSPGKILTKGKFIFQ